MGDRSGSASSAASRLRSRPPLLAIVGPTASGKTRIAVEVAGELPFGVEILSCDSIAVYRGLDVLSAKPTADERAAVPHHLVDLVDPSEPFTAADYVAGFRDVVDQVRSRGHIPLLVGGSGLYFRAVVDGLAFAPTDPSVRARLELDDPDALYARLVRADPEAAARIDRRNPRRIVRAVEILEMTKRPPTEFRGRWNRPGGVAAAGLRWQREDLYARIERRIDAMLAGGLIDEVRAARGAGLARTAGQAVGVKEVLGYLDGTATLDDVRTVLLRNTKRFVRRQDSWFKADPRVTWFDVSDLGWHAARDGIVRLFADAVRG